MPIVPPSANTAAGRPESVNGDWLIRGRDGRLSAYDAVGDGIVCRAESRPGGPWLASRRIGGDQRVHPLLGVGQGADEYAHLAAWRPTVKGEAGLIHTTHFRPALAALDWTPLGHPNQKGDWTGVPAVAVDAEGRAHVFVRNAVGGVSMRGQKERGGWGPWRDLKGEDVEEQLTAVTRTSGRVELYGNSPHGILRWTQGGPGWIPELDEAPLKVTARQGSLRALVTSDEHVTLFYTDDTDTVCAWRPGSEPVELLAGAGPGPVSVIRCTLDEVDCTVLAQRSASGRVAFAAYPTEQESAGAWWTESGPQLPLDARVSLAEDTGGRVVAATMAAGELAVARQKGEPGLALDAWRTL
ncbi:hypothetical protein ACKI1I_16000 [Streptomyces turgidiscabies]|uniref:Uncharacterized protein n=1 Tax=Streptomyces turgidiscabies (strain Car8) TaxID=698760 RepID=L7FHQ6_STRT8|nr:MULTISPECIES: hypothetical protein [Streptomyces]ELP70240.1 hypothetical protein STRTUCAR8_08317 [Streptomyces turgidiscabies Car8]MDX3495171.1 hypothetical protein [Streptomyces turgidiscabies]GAQ71044.1 hypothetical protein T45_02786 [Streptomyces turgidiscabies]